MYIDETTVNTFMRPSRVWSYADRPVDHVLPSKRLGLTIYGAIGHCLRGPVFMTGGTTNKQEFITFVKRLSTSISNNVVCKPLLVLDNHRAHVSIEARQLIDQHFRALFMPAYSCRFNCIETLWAIFKSMFKRRVQTISPS